VRVYTERGAENEAELVRRIGNAEVAINIRAHARFTEAVFHGCPGLRMISIWGTGTDNIDLPAAARHGVTVCNTPGINAYAVAEHTIALMLAAARRIPGIDRDMRAGAWPRDMLVQLHGKTLAVFGAGAIGARVAQLARGFGMEVLSWSARADTAAAKEDFLRRAEFGLMKPEAFLINTSRGALIDREALLEALAAGMIAGAGLDVFHEEPVKPDDPLLSSARTVLSPHNAGQTPEVRRDGLLCAVENIEAFLAGRPANVVRAR
jgi:phosphoglycerate dehydrogenase-like enzyme